MRIERSFDREDLRSEVLTLAYGRRLAGLLMALGFVMNTAAALAGRDPLRRDDWVNELEAYYSAKEAARLLLDLWEPQELDATAVNVQSVASRPGAHAFVALQSLVQRLARMEEARKKDPEVERDTGFDLIRPMAAAMVEEFPALERRVIKSWAMVDGVERKLAEEKVIKLRGKAS
jgi:hypothetical protein